MRSINRAREARRGENLERTLRGVGPLLLSVNGHIEIYTRDGDRAQIEVKGDILVGPVDYHYEEMKQ